MKAFLIAAVSLVLLTSCSSDSSSDSNTNGGSTVAQEINPVKNFYSSNGATFKYRLYNFPPTDGDTNNNNIHTAEIYKIIEEAGVFSVMAKFTLPAIDLVSYGATLNCQGDFNSPTIKNNVLIQPLSAFDDFEIDKNFTRLVSYNYSGGSRGAYGFSGARIYVHNPTYFSEAISASANQGYMHTLSDSNFMLSMGLNSNVGKPMFYQYNPSTYTWTGTVVPQMDYVQGSGVNIPTTNDASKAGNSDKVFWAWLSFTSTPDNGKINIISFNYASGFSIVTSLGSIGSIGIGLSMEYKHTITLCKNPNNLNNPYMVVRRYNTDILDIYKFTGTAIEVVKTGVTLPSSISLLPGNTIRIFKEIKFTGNNVYLITGFDKNLYKLSGSTFVIDKPNVTLEEDRISAIESTSEGILMSVVKEVDSKPLPKVVSDVVFIPNN